MAEFSPEAVRVRNAKAKAAPPQTAAPATSGGSRSGGKRTAKASPAPAAPAPPPAAPMDRRQAEDLVNKLYSEILGRSPDQGGFALYVNALAEGRLKEEEVRFILEGSPEAKAPETLERRLQTTRPDLVGLLQVPELRNILLTATKEKWSAERVQGALQGTGWWRNTNPAARRWQVMDPAERQVEVEQVTFRLAEEWTRTYGKPRPIESIRIEAERVASGQQTLEAWLYQRDRPEFAQRFPGIAARERAGLPTLKPEQVLQLENEYRNVLRQAGADPSRYDDPNDFVPLQVQDISPAELADRVKRFQKISTLGPKVKQAFAQHAGINLEDKDLFGLVSGQRPDLAEAYTKAITQQNPQVQPPSLFQLEEAERKAVQEDQALFRAGGQVAIENERRREETF